jgi:hypothetical protein
MGRVFCIIPSLYCNQRFFASFGIPVIFVVARSVFYDEAIQKAAWIATPSKERWARNDEDRGHSERAEFLCH